MLWHVRSRSYSLSLLYKVKAIQFDLDLHKSYKA